MEHLNTVHVIPDYDNLNDEELLPPPVLVRQTNAPPGWWDMVDDLLPVTMEGEDIPLPDLVDQEPDTTSLWDLIEAELQLPLELEDLEHPEFPEPPQLVRQDANIPGYPTTVPDFSDDEEEEDEDFTDQESTATEIEEMSVVTDYSTEDEEENSGNLLYTLIYPSHPACQ